jgi:transcription elongation factor S-II
MFLYQHLVYEMAATRGRESAASAATILRRRRHNKRQEKTERRKRTTMFACRNCKSDDVSFTQRQMRSADEPMTLFFVCNGCGKTWKT